MFFCSPPTNSHSVVICEYRHDCGCPFRILSSFTNLSNFFSTHSFRAYGTGLALQNLDLPSVSTINSTSNLLRVAIDDNVVGS